MSKITQKRDRLKAFDRLEPYEVWEPQRSRSQAIPARSRLYSLQPMGMGTGDVENLTSYFLRLVDAHGVSPNGLMRQMILPVLNDMRPGRYPDGRLPAGRVAFGWGSLHRNPTWTVDMVQVLSRLTLRSDLRAMTLLAWQPVVAHFELLHKMRRWCPACYAQWVRQGLPLYDPLRWTLKPITVCLTHKRRLRFECPHCQKRQSQLAGQTSFGYCRHCCHWLGDALEDTPVTPDGLNKSHLKPIDPYDVIEPLEMDWQCWISSALNSLLVGISATQTLDPQLAINNMRGLISKYTDGSKRAFALRLGVKPHLLSEWVRDKKRISIGILLPICRSLGVMPVEFLTRDWSNPALAKYALSAPLPRPDKTVKRATDAEIEQLLRQAIARNDQATSVKDLTSYRMIWKPSKRGEATIKLKFPELVRVLLDQFDERHMALGAARRCAECARIRQVVEDLHCAGQYPSHARVLIRVGLKRSTRWTLSAWQQAKKECGY